MLMSLAALAATVLGLAPAAPTLTGPAAVRPAQAITVTASGLTPGRGHRLAIVTGATGSQTVCSGPIATATPAPDGRARFSGRVPLQLGCVLPDGSRVARIELDPKARHQLSACVAVNANLCHGGFALARRPVRVLPPALACRQVGFVDNSDDVAARIRATGTTCATARAVAYRSHGPSGACFAGRPCAYRAQGFACRGSVVREALPSVRWHCTRASALITFTKT